MKYNAKEAILRELGTPIDVAGFLKRGDISESVKDRVLKAGELIVKSPTDAEYGDAYRCMQAQILIEVSKLDEDLEEQTEV